jgi:HEPN domain-containing protein
MTDEEKYLHWVKLAEYDMETAEAMFKSGRWLYVIIMCQQALEKLCKALYVLYIDDDVPHIHNIRAIFERFSDKLSSSNTEYNSLFDTLTSFYIQGRYTDYESTYRDTLTKGSSQETLKKAKEAFSWLLTLKP